ncbi:MAG: flagellar motor switch protein FliN [Fimbriimonadaceae bacterium]|nr:flagellar motor switch protein FliN [Fimbriimonadaceae bacterium]
MQKITEELVQKFTNAQNQIWQTVSNAASESIEAGIQFRDPKVSVMPLTDVYSEMASPKLVVQFCFADSPDSIQAVLVPTEGFLALHELLTSETKTIADDQMAGKVRPFVEGLVQGICQATGTIRNEPIVASGLSNRYQIFNLPSNLQRMPELIKVDVTISGEGVETTAMWLVDMSTARHITNTPENGEEELAVSVLGAQTAEAGVSGPALSVDDSALEMIMDIPLEISVELGRMRMLVKDVVELGSGSIVQIDKAAGEPVDVLVNGRLVARGEVVVIEDNFGVRITEILSLQERLAKLNEVA